VWSDSFSSQSHPEKRETDGFDTPFCFFIYFYFYFCNLVIVAGVGSGFPIGAVLKTWGGRKKEVS
jgi:hypothetical protein